LDKIVPCQRQIGLLFPKKISRPATVQIPPVLAITPFGDLALGDDDIKKALYAGTITEVKYDEKGKGI
jgi:hypothetical protein